MKVLQNGEYSTAALVRALSVAAAAAVLFTATTVYACGMHHAEHPEFTSNHCWKKKVLEPVFTSNEKKDSGIEESTHVSEECSKWREWKQKEFSRKPKATTGHPPLPKMKPEAAPAFPPPVTGQLLQRFADWILSAIASPAYAQATTNPQYDNIVIDGDLSDWSPSDRINLPDNAPPYLATGG